MKSNRLPSPLVALVQSRRLATDDSQNGTRIKRDGAPPRRPVHRAIRWPLSSLVALAAAGCQSLTYTGPNGEHFCRNSFASTTAIQSLSVEASSNGVRRVELRGYTNDSTQALGAVTEAAVRAALQAAKP